MTGGVVAAVVIGGSAEPADAGMSLWLRGRGFLCQKSGMRLLILAPFLLLLVLFALSNTAPIRIGLWPTGLSLEAPLSLVVLGGMAVAFLSGGLVVWVSELGQRRRARRAEHAVRLLEAQVAALKARLPQTALGPSAE